MKLRHLYLILCVLGIVLPYSQFIPFVSEYGLNFSTFFQQLFANHISAFFGLDVIVSAIVLIVYVFSEGNRLGMRHLWLPILATFTVGVSLGLPLFFYMRELHLEKD
jgi:hypothetical protein